ncbi:MAG: efflux RND transporter periplasmic adaptor subunit [Bacteroidales bacterium]|nr:efflux RND transporter periplasmic adaptor subunit [Bacteroidales bacterium]
MQFRHAILAMVISAVALAGCHDHDHDLEEEGHHHSFLLTSYSDTHEIFAEIDPMVAGEHAHALVHLTRLKDFKPVEKGALKASLNVGKPEVIVVEEPSSPGIYKLEFHPSAAGSGTITFEISGDTPDTVSVPVTVFDNEESADEAVEEAEIKNSNAIVFPKEQSWKIDFSTEECHAVKLGQVIKTMAQVLPSLGDERVITTPVAGTVTFSSDAIVEGKQVSPGQLLFTVDNSGLKDEGNIAVMSSQAESDYNLALSEYERKAALAQDRIVSQSDLQTAKRNLEAAKARYDNLRRGYLAGKQRVTSPIGGYVTSVNARSGGFVETGQVVMTISKGGSMYLKAELQPKYFSALGGLSSVNVRMPSGEVLSLEDLGGSMLSYGKSIGADSPLIPVTFQIRRIGDILPGTFMEIFLVCESGRAGLSVPVESIVEEMGNYFVFVQLTPELFEKREVSLGASDGIRREILSGLSEGERVVGKGAVLVKLSQAAGKLDAHSGHVH